MILLILWFTLSIQGHHYALLPSSESIGHAPEDDPHVVVYSEINPKSQVAKAEVGASERQSTPSKQGYRNSWLSALNLSENRLGVVD